MNLIKYRYWYFAISLLVIVPGVLALIILGFTAGDRLHRRQPAGSDFKSGTPPTIAQVETIYSNLSTSTVNIANPEVQPLGTDGLSIRSREMNDATKSKVVAALKASTAADRMWSSRTSTR